MVSTSADRPHSTTPARTLHDPWPDHVVRGVAEVLGDTEQGLTGTEMGRLLAQVNVPDPLATATKRDRLHEALRQRQHQDRASNCIIAFIAAAMAPVRYRDDQALFSLRQDQLAEVLVFVGMRVNDRGQVARGARASTLSEAAAHANSLHAELRRRGAHPRVLDSCSTEVLTKNAFHAALEATKGAAEHLRELTGLDLDGAKLVDAALALGSSGTPQVAVNLLATSSDRDEQTGFATMVKGLFGMYRNPVAHDPRARRKVTDEELLELLTMVSMVHRRLDGARAAQPRQG